MAEWLGNGLQNRVQQFESAWYLLKKGDFLTKVSLFVFVLFNNEIADQARFLGRNIVNYLRPIFLSNFRPKTNNGMRKKAELKVCLQSLSSATSVPINHRDPLL